jgi:hypothetical protein
VDHPKRPLELRAEGSPRFEQAGDGGEHRVERCSKLVREHRQEPIFRGLRLVQLGEHAAVVDGERRAPRELDGELDVGRIESRRRAGGEKDEHAEHLAPPREREGHERAQIEIERQRIHDLRFSGEDRFHDGRTNAQGCGKRVARESVGTNARSDRRRAMQDAARIVEQLGRACVGQERHDQRRQAIEAGGGRRDRGEKGRRSIECLEHLFVAPSLAHVEEESHHFHGIVRRHRAHHLDDDPLGSAHGERELDRGAGRIAGERVQVLLEGVAGGRFEQRGERTPEQLARARSEKRDGRMVQLSNLSREVEGHVRDGCVHVEIEVPIARGFERRLRFS